MKSKPGEKKPSIRKLVETRPDEAIRRYAKILSNAEFLACQEKAPAAAAKHAPERVSREQIRAWAKPDPRIILENMPGHVPPEQLWDIVAAFRQTTLEILQDRNNTHGAELAKALSPLFQKLLLEDPEIHRAATGRLSLEI